MIRLSVALLVALVTASVGANENTISMSVTPQGRPIERKLQDQTIGAIAGATEDLSELFGLLERLNLTPILSNPILKLTLFAPVNSAFDALDTELRLSLLDDSFSRHLSEVLLYHVTDGENLSTGLSNGQELTMINENKGVVGVSVTLDANGNVVRLSDSRGDRATVIDFDILARNGVVHLIDAVLLPSFLFRRASDLGENYSTLISLAVLAGVDAGLQTRTITLFAPTNDAFAALPAATLETLSSPEGLDTLVDILSYHVVLAVITSDKLEGTTEVTTTQGNTVSVTVLADGTVTVNDATVVEPDILARNGVTHGIDQVLIPPLAASSSPTSSPIVTATSGPPTTSAPSASPTTAAPSTSPTAPLLSLLDLASDTPALSTLVTAIVAADLTPILSSALFDLTVFAPTNDAFAALDPDTLTRLLTTPFQLHLVDVLLYHALDDENLAASLLDGKQLVMGNDEIVTVGVDATTVSLSNSQGVSALVIDVDIAASNGVVHVIDGVLLPSFVYRTVIDLEDNYSTLMTVIELAELADTLKASTFTLFAPTNDAFAKLGQETLDFLTSPDGKAALTDTLRNHVISEVIAAEKLVDGATVVTAQGLNVIIGVLDGTVMVNDAIVVKKDMLAINGITHGIDTVLTLPLAAEKSAPTMAPTTTTSSGVKFGKSFLGLLVMALAMTMTY
jgi:transforming growth factor-beta-induced protein